MTLKQLIVRNTGPQIAAQGVSLALGLATTAVLSRYLGVERFGQFSYIFAFFYFFLTLNDFGVAIVVVREASQHRERAGEIIGSLLLFKLGLAAVSVIAAWTAIWLMGFPPDLGRALAIYALILPMIALQLPASIFQVVLDLRYPSILGIVNRVATFALVMAGIAFRVGVPGLAALLVVAEAVSAATLLFGARKISRPVLSIDLDLWRKVLRSSVPLGLTGLCVAIINRADFIMLERMTDLQQVGLYSAAYRVTNVLESLPLMLMGTIYPLMSRAASDRDQLRVVFRQSVILLGAIALPMGIAVSVGAPLIVRLLFGQRFAGADRALSVLVWSTASLYVAIVAGNLLISIGRERTNLLLNVIGAALNMLLNILLIPRWGFVGAAVATSATYFFILMSMMTAATLALYPLGTRPVLLGGSPKPLADLR
jgi:O-antigen/teichoic acid export membrane protein